MKKQETILNIAAGKFPPLELPEYYYILNLDTMYYQANTPEQVEENYFKSRVYEKSVEYCNADAYEFMERTKMKFDKVCIYRFLEHVPMDRLLYFIYLVSCVTKKGAEVDVIVPNYAVLAEMLLREHTTHPNFEKQNVELTTELLNEPSCPHASIWTVDRAKYFWEFEGRFKVKVIVPNFTYDGREIYMRFKVQRV
jgi:hypothetical protein